jgi:hypothetical protein
LKLPFVAFVALTSTVVAAPASFAGTDYAERVCETLAASVATRLAERLVQVKRGTKRVRGFTLAAGAAGLVTIGPVDGASCPARWHLTVRRSPVVW